MDPARSGFIDRTHKLGGIQNTRRNSRQNLAEFPGFSWVSCRQERQGKGLIQRGVELLAKLKLFGRPGVAGKPLDLFVKLQPKISLAHAKKAVDTKRVTKGDLRTILLRYNDGEDAFVVTPAAFVRK